MKRLFDLVVSLIVVVLMAPLFAVLAIWIKCDSRGPVFFRQVRVGRGGRNFRIIKFRTMHTGAESAGPQITIGVDPRITDCGAALRRYKFDELPQFLNVLAGQMSIVGPRPEVPRYVDTYADDMRRIVLSRKPGITDPASIRFRAESEVLKRSADPERTYVEEIIPLKLRISAEYIERQNFWSDIGVIMKTLTVLRR